MKVHSITYVFPDGHRRYWDVLHRYVIPGYVNTLLCVDQDSVAGSVIQASGMVLFEDALEAGTLGVDILSAPSVRTTPVVKLAP